MRRGALISVPSLPVEFVEGGNATLSPGKEFWVTAPTKLTLARSARAGDRLVLVNNTEGVLTIAGSNLSGVDSFRSAFSGQSQVWLPAGGEARLMRSRRGWRAQGCDRVGLVFSYNGTPLASNPGNPNSAGDLFHYLGGVGTFTNPATSGAVTAATNSVANGLGGVSVLTDRVATPSSATQNWQPNNVANSWVAWQFAAAFAPSGLLLQSAGYTNNYHIRSFELRYTNDLAASLTASSAVGDWMQGTSWLNQSQITGAAAWFYFPISGMPAARRWAIRAIGPDSAGSNYPTVCEINWFGLYVV